MKNFGEIVYAAYVYKNAEEFVVCPICCGKKYLVVILGDGEQVSIDCSFCGIGLNEPSGRIVEYAPKKRIEAQAVNKIEMRGSKIIYNDLDNCFESEIEAEAWANEEMKKIEEEEKHRLEFLKENERKTWAWNAGYHRRELKKAERNIEYHTRKLNAAKAFAKNEKEFLSNEVSK